MIDGYAKLNLCDLLRIKMVYPQTVTILIAIDWLIGLVTTQMGCHISFQLPVHDNWSLHVTRSPGQLSATECTFTNQSAVMLCYWEVKVDISRICWQLNCVTPCKMCGISEHFTICFMCYTNVLCFSSVLIISQVLPSIHTVSLCWADVWSLDG